VKHMRMRMLYMVLIAVAATTLLATLPAMAASPTSFTVFDPIGTNGATYSCTGGPPFVFNEQDQTSGNCGVEHVGAPGGLLCDVPTSLTLVHDGHRLGDAAKLCQ
jgi:hypothetical protein